MTDKPWQGWYRCVANTYGTWLPGDPRGFRTRKHREHVEGDYKSPPTVDYSKRHAAAKGAMKREAVYLSAEARRVAAEAVRHALVDVHQLEVLAVAVSSSHMHVLVRLPRELAQKPTLSKRGLGMSSVHDPPRHYMGIAKKECAKRLAREGLVKPGGVWARRGKIVRVEDRGHQVNVFRYIVAHKKQGAAVWTFKDRGA